MKTLNDKIDDEDQTAFYQFEQLRNAVENLVFTLANELDALVEKLKEINNEEER